MWPAPLLLISQKVIQLLWDQVRITYNIGEHIPGDVHNQKPLAVNLNSSSGFVKLLFKVPSFLHLILQK